MVAPEASRDATAQGAPLMVRAARAHERCGVSALSGRMHEAQPWSHGVGDGAPTSGQRRNLGLPGLALSALST